MTMTKDEALKLALSTLDEVRQETFRLIRDGQTLYAEDKVWSTIISIKEVLAQPEQEPVEIDQATMELAESVGLIGPTSRTHDLHQAIQRFHDLICVNATVKAAQMAADVIRESTPPQNTWVGLTDEEKHEIRYSHMTSAEFIEFIEAKLKDKNT